MQDTKIKNQARFRQKVKFDNVSGYQGTDLDYVCDVKGKAMVYAEIKCEGTRITTGQKILAENLVKNSRIPSFFFSLTHNTDPSEDIILGGTKVEGLWHSEGDGSLSLIHI